MLNKNNNQQTTRNSHCQTKDIDYGVDFLLRKTSKGYFDVVLDHGFSL
jgi:hypothetical protein